MAPDASTSPVEWGAEIRVNNCKPDGLAEDRTPVWWTDGDYSNVSTTGDLIWKQGGRPLCAIRLPADHPHYRQPTTPEHDPALWDRMVALVRRVADIWPADEGYEARAILADLPKAVDPATAAVERLLGEYAAGFATTADEVLAAELARKAFALGRELAGEQA